MLGIGIYKKEVSRDIVGEFDRRPALLKHSLRDLFSLLLLSFYVFKASKYFVIASLIIN